MFVEFFPMVLCWCSGLFYWHVNKLCIVSLYSFYSCGLTLYGVCDISTGGCVELYGTMVVMMMMMMIQFNSSLLFTCQVNSYKANYRHSTV
jgi:hypothetical protein